MRHVLFAAALLLSACAAPDMTPETTTHTTEPGPEPTGASALRPIETREVQYSSNGTDLTGYLARPADLDGPAPGVLVVHEWWGHNDYVRGRAEELAQLGYVAFALDMYGSGKTASHPEDATAFMTEVMNNAELMEGRFVAALEVLNAQPGVDAGRTAAVGYCMGGGIALRMGRQLTAIDAVASFHGSLGAALDAGNAGGLTHALIATGQDDPFVPMDTVTSLEKELLALSDMETVTTLIFPGVVHGFTNPAATELGTEFDLPLRYDAEADAASWAALKTLLREAFQG